MNAWPSRSLIAASPCGPPRRSSSAFTFSQTSGSPRSASATSRFTTPAPLGETSDDIGALLLPVSGPCFLPCRILRQPGKMTADPRNRQTEQTPIARKKVDPGGVDEVRGGWYLLTFLRDERGSSGRSR